MPIALTVTITLMQLATLADIATTAAILAAGGYEASPLPAAMIAAWGAPLAFAVVLFAGFAWAALAVTLARLASRYRGYEATTLRAMLLVGTGAIALAHATAAARNLALLNLALLTTLTAR